MSTMEGDTREQALALAYLANDVAAKFQFMDEALNDFLSKSKRAKLSADMALLADLRADCEAALAAYEALRASLAG